MTWWAWTLLWIVLVAGALGVFFLVGRSLWRKGMALLTELGTASDRLGSVADELEALNASAAQAEQLAVFASPTALRQQRYTAGRAKGRRRGSARGSGQDSRRDSGRGSARPESAV